MSSFISIFEGLATQIKAQLKLKFFEAETAIKIKLCSFLERRNQRHSQRERVIDFDDDEYFIDTAEEKELSTQFPQLQKTQLIYLQEHFEWFCNTLPVSGFNSTKYDINLIKSYLLPILVNGLQIEPAVIKKTNQFVSFKFGDVQFLIFWIFLVGLLVLICSLKPKK